MYYTKVKPKISLRPFVNMTLIIFFMFIYFIPGLDMKLDEYYVHFNDKIIKIFFLRITTTAF